ncbi:MAG TPA: glycosyltransferase family 9 protein [Gammaproteobacteria bacterium]|nr:glycosyltransferase family 9 protein [Gammaproteobacteria bacterium]
MPLPLSSPPKRICILRLSALGDITHVLPTLRTFQHHWPDTRITWVTGKTEYALVKDIPDIEFIIFDKSAGAAAYFDIRRQLKNHQFDVLLHMQLAIRASLLCALIPARIKLGFDKARAKDLQWLFTNHQIKPSSLQQHVVDSFLEFPKFFGLTPVMQWDLPVSDAALKNVTQLVSHQQISTDVRNKKILVINPCAVAKSRNWRNWHAAGYAAVANHAASQLGMLVVLTGGRSKLETDTAQAIASLCEIKPVNLVGKTTISELVAILSMARVVIAPDTGPTHIANALNTPVIGLYAATNPDRAGPYRFQEYVVNLYPTALEKYYGLSVDDAPWGKRIRNDECMSLIQPDAVIRTLEKVLVDYQD